MIFFLVTRKVANQMAIYITYFFSFQSLSLLSRAFRDRQHTDGMCVTGLLVLCISPHRKDRMTKWQKIHFRDGYSVFDDITFFGWGEKHQRH